MHDTPESMLLQAAESIGKLKDVGHRFKPEMDPVSAGKWLSRCLNDEHAQRLNYGQELLLWRMACQAGEHEAFRAYAAAIGYRIEPIDQAGELLATLRRAEAMAERAGELTREAKARMQAAGLKLEGMA